MTFSLTDWGDPLTWQQDWIKSASGGTAVYKGLNQYFEFYSQKRKHQSLEFQTPQQVFDLKAQAARIQRFFNPIVPYGWEALHTTHSKYGQTPLYFRAQLINIEYAAGTIHACNLQPFGVMGFIFTLLYHQDLVQRCQLRYPLCLRFHSKRFHDPWSPRNFCWDILRITEIWCRKNIREHPFSSRRHEDRFHHFNYWDILVFDFR